MKHIGYRPDIDALRGVAVLLVVLFHAFPAYLPGGFIGVDVFFVISGFLITSIIYDSLLTKDFTFSDFYSRRIRRLFPALITVLSFTLVVGWLILYPNELKQLANHVYRSIVFTLNFRLLDEVGYFDVESHYKPLLHLWTLSVEEQYYLLWPVFVVVILKFKKNPLAFIIFIAFSSLIASIYFTSQYPQESFYHTGVRFWELATGSILSILWSKVVKRVEGGRPFFFFLGMCFILTSGFTLNSDSVFPGYLAIFPIIGALLVIIGNVEFKTYLGLRYLGLISYPLYLWHYVLFSFLTIYLGRKPEEIWMLFAIGLSVLLAFLTYKIIEPIRYKKSTHYLLIFIALIGIFAYLIKSDEGVPTRSHIAYLLDADKQFQRTPDEDIQCKEYVQTLGIAARQFYYCRADALDKSNLIALIGDSHAHAFYPGLKEIAENNNYGIVLLANSSCPPFKGFLWGRNNNEIDQCKASIEQIYSVVSKDPRISKVFLSTRGPVYIHGEVKGVFTDVSVAESLKKYRNDRQTYDSYFSAFSDTLKLLDSVHHLDEVFYLLENPELDFLPKEVIKRPFDNYGLSINRDFVSRRLYLKRMEKYRNLVNNLSSKKLTVLDPSNVFCEDDFCYSSIENKFLYADDDHTSIFGSKYIARQMEKLIFKKMKFAVGGLA